MDLSFLKWPIIIVVVLGGAWLLSDGGVNYMEKRFTADQPGKDAQVDKADEAGLSRLGAFLMFTFRYKHADQIFQKCAQRYPNGANYWLNLFRRARLQEKLAGGTSDPQKSKMFYQASLDILVHLIKVNAHEKDDRVPNNDILRLRADKLAEVHELGEVGQF